ncbi:CBS domain-containing protein [Cloacibacterium normanense]|jgi:CBS domain-containing protein|uniref:CBS domain protein n=1 Tax=Cloacibacterium normanense TaxID=237258 RepID=A0A1E5UGP6_9FLAO|nr:CBS domain-containing protein [Cloacibacterium normanense]OEL12027.1 CBS domain protein [Cloacibacterium normanense]SDO41326.1 CBS domain-containing protein [Cloacibacterium normanense]
MRTIKHILDRKSRELAIIEPEKTVFEALKLMADKNIGSVIVMDGTRYLGILSERNYARQVVLLNKSSKELAVREIMRTDLPKLSKNDPIEKCMEIMAQLNVRYLPVVENETLIGLISVKDLLDEVLLHQKDVIENLTHYINT